MSKTLLFVCLVLFGTVLAQTQMRLLNARYYSDRAIGLTVDFIFGNTTLTDGAITKFDTAPGGPSFPATGYLALPTYEFTVGTGIDLYAFDRESFIDAPILESLGDGLLNVTLDELQSYSVVYFGQTEDILDPRANIGDMIKLYEERPNPSPVGKALVRIVNCAVSTYELTSTLDVVINGIGVPEKTVSLEFGEASDFLEYDTAASLEFNLALPIAGDTTRARVLEFTTAIDHTTMVYIRGDLPNAAQLGQVMNNVAFAFPAAPSAPTATPTAPVDPVAPVAEEPSAAPDAPSGAPSTTPNPGTAPSRVPTRRVSSAATTVAQIAGVAGAIALLF